MKRVFPRSHVPAPRAPRSQKTRVKRFSKTHAIENQADKV